jgi:hypothetical protein
VAAGQAEVVSFVVRGAAWCFVLVMGMFFSGLSWVISHVALAVVGALIPYSYLDRTANPYIIFMYVFKSLFGDTNSWV